MIKLGGRVLLWMIFSASFAGFVSFAWRSGQDAFTARQSMEKAVQNMGLLDRIEAMGEGFLTQLFGARENSNSKVARLARDMAAAESFRKNSWKTAWISLALLAGAIVSGFAAAKGANLPLGGVMLQFCSLVCLAFGLFVPVMTIVAFQEFVALGPVVFQFQSKGILETVVHLWETVWPVAALIFVFSVLNPLLKTTLSIIAILRVRNATGWRFVVKHLGKWSMADVFIVAILLSWFALSRDPASVAQLEPGIAYFTAFCLLSVSGSHIIEHREKQILAQIS